MKTFEEFLSEGITLKYIWDHISDALASGDIHVGFMDATKKLAKEWEKQYIKRFNDPKDPLYKKRIKYWYNDEGLNIQFMGPISAWPGKI